MWVKTRSETLVNQCLVVKNEYIRYAWCIYGVCVYNVILYIIIYIYDMHYYVFILCNSDVYKCIWCIWFKWCMWHIILYPQWTSNTFWCLRPLTLLTWIDWPWVWSMDLPKLPKVRFLRICWAWCGSGIHICLICEYYKTMDLLDSSTRCFFLHASNKFK